MISVKRAEEMADQLRPELATVCPNLSLMVGTRQMRPLSGEPREAPVFVLSIEGGRWSVDPTSKVSDIIRALQARGHLGT